MLTRNPIRLSPWPYCTCQRLYPHCDGCKERQRHARLHPPGRRNDVRDISATTSSGSARQRLRVLWPYSSRNPRQGETGSTTGEPWEQTNRGRRGYFHRHVSNCAQGVPKASLRRKHRAPAPTSVRQLAKAAVSHPAGQQRQQPSRFKGARATEALGATVGRAARRYARTFCEYEDESR